MSFGCLTFIHASQYVYPVAHFSDAKEEHLMVIKQLDVDLLELYDINPVTKRSEKILCTMYIPGSVRLLPGNVGFSFVDNGRIKVKKFMKRSPKAIDFFEPVYGIELIEWLDDQTGYFHASLDNHVGLYEFNIEGDLTCLLSSEIFDYLYPHIIDDQLWFIGKTYDKEQRRFYIGQAAYNPHVPATEIHEIVNFGTTAIVLLRMASSTRAYVVAYDPSCDSLSPLIQLHYYCIEKGADSWHAARLFDFYVPGWMLFDETKRLYESLLPLLPQQWRTSIFFSSHCSEYGHLAIYRYDLKSQKISLVAHSCTDLLVPLLHDNSGWLGYAIATDSALCLPEILVDEPLDLSLQAVCL